MIVITLQPFQCLLETDNSDMLLHVSYNLFFNDIFNLFFKNTNKNFFEDRHMAVVNYFKHTCTGINVILAKDLS